MIYNFTRLTVGQGVAISPVWQGFRISDLGSSLPPQLPTFFTIYHPSSRVAEKATHYWAHYNPSSRVAEKATHYWAHYNLLPTTHFSIYNPRIYIYCNT
jgi:hypothetical protein